MSDKLSRPYYAVLQNGYPAEQKHHIFPGSLYRKLCEKYNLWVPISAAMHEFAHCRGMQAVGLIQPLFETPLNKSNIEEILAREFCDCIGVDYDKALYALKNYNNVDDMGISESVLKIMAITAAEHLQAMER